MKVVDLEIRVQEIEGINIMLHWPDGRNVRGDYSDLRLYPHETPANDEWTVQEWINERFKPWYPGFDVVVVNSAGKSVARNTKLKTLRYS